ncbi:Uncharacterized protein dnm_045220 [Desulfonema magnum]|uniref:Uncharacterized protein n=1 Tax=Desulfonema magnum TaxID=45655 RepID=A0A975BN12_9BACT|nr:Uncharacterized protein dnm_045220 [Desulfonema magnum]
MTFSDGSNLSRARENNALQADCPEVVTAYKHLNTEDAK